jgi:hypothetical protein
VEVAEWLEVDSVRLSSTADGAGATVAHVDTGVSGMQSLLGSDVNPSSAVVVIIGPGRFEVKGGDGWGLGADIP